MFSQYKTEEWTSMQKILIVEDDRKIAQLESDYLESNGYETKIIEDGKRHFPN